MQDVVRKRREYLLAMAGANVQNLVGAGMVIVFGAMALMFFFVSTVWFMSCAEAGVVDFAAWIVLSMAFLFGGMVIAGGWIMNRSHEKITSTRYVPPVREQIARLPPAEILVRGSHRLAAPPDTLLRVPAVRAGADSRGLLLPLQETSHPNECK